MMNEQDELLRDIDQLRREIDKAKRHLMKVGYFLGGAELLSRLEKAGAFLDDETPKRRAKIGDERDVQGGR